jgi:hypothetical protein
MRNFLLATSAAAAFALIAMPAIGQQVTPKKANKFQSTLVEGVEACTAATTTTGGVINLPACDYTPSDSFCHYTTKNGKLKGKGAVKATSKKGDIFIAVKMSGLNDECNGESLCPVASFRATQDNCTSGDSCTTEDQTDFPLGLVCCTVEKGKCKIKASLNDALGGAIVAANNPSFTLNGVGMARIGGGVPFRGGIMVELP